jgi:ABC-type nitrate/sulfonate/bicarbonate transport system substrate-binding protein
MMNLRRLLGCSYAAKLVSVLVVFAAAPLFVAPSQAQLRVALTSFSSDFAGIYTASHLGLFAKEGIQVETILISSSAINVPALLAKEIDVLMSAGEAGIRVYNEGYKSIRIIGSIIDRFTFTLMVKPTINAPAELRSQTLAVTRFGGSLDTSLRYALKYLKLDPKENSITILQLGRSEDILAALAAKKIDGAMLNSVIARKATQMGFKTLLDLGTMNIKYPQSSMLTRQDVIDRKKEQLTKFLRAYLIGLDRFIKDKKLGIKVLTTFTPVKDETIASLDHDDWSKKYLDQQAVTTRELISGPLEQLGITKDSEKEKLFLDVVNNSLVNEAKSFRQ